jgi:hypothetical protein
MVVCVPRQSGKTRLVLSVCVDRALSQEGVRCWYTAQHRKDAVYRWRDLVRLLRGSPLRERRTHAGHKDTEPWDYRVRAAAGDSEIEFANGSSIAVFAPVEDSLHGSVTDLVVLDEARFFDPFQGDGLLAAALPTQATRDGQVWITSTAGGPDSLFLARQVEAARASVDRPDGRIGVAEWGIDPDVPPGGLLEAVWAAHPSAGLPGGPVRDALAVAAEQMPGWQFAHEYGNRWRTEAEARVLPPGAWEQCRQTEPLAPGRPTFAVDVPPDRSESTIVACVDGVLEVVDHVPTVTVAARVVELVEAWDPVCVAVDAAGPAGTVAEQLRPVFDRLVVTSTRELQVACAGFYDAVHAGTVRHRPSLLLDQAAALAVKRPVGQAWVWSRVDGGAPLVAASLALWASQREAPPVLEPSMIY